MIKEIYTMIYADMPASTLDQDQMHREIERIKDPLRNRLDFEKLEEICLEVSCCSHESGFVSGFKAGVAFMAECLNEMR